MKSPSLDDDVSRYLSRTFLASDSVCACLFWAFDDERTSCTLPESALLILVYLFSRMAPMYEESLLKSRGEGDRGEEKKRVRSAFREISLGVRIVILD